MLLNTLPLSWRAEFGLSPWVWELQKTPMLTSQPPRQLFLLAGGKSEVDRAIPGNYRTLNTRRTGICGALIPLRITPFENPHQPADSSCADVLLCWSRETGGNLSQSQGVEAEYTSMPAAAYKDRDLSRETLTLMNLPRSPAGETNAVGFSCRPKPSIERKSVGLAPNDVSLEGDVDVYIYTGAWIASEQQHMMARLSRAWPRKNIPSA